MRLRKNKKPSTKGGSATARDPLAMARAENARLTERVEALKEAVTGRTAAICRAEAAEARAAALEKERDFWRAEAVARADERAKEFRRHDEQLAALSGVLERAREALMVFKRYGTHRKSCVQMTGRPCSCGFDHAATLAGAIAAPNAATKPRPNCFGEGTPGTILGLDGRRHPCPKCAKPPERVRETFKNKDGVIEACVSISQRELKEPPEAAPCARDGCPGLGVPGNENIVGGKAYCDGCEPKKAPRTRP